MNIHTKYFDNLLQFNKFMNELAQREDKEEVSLDDITEPTDKDLKELESDDEKAD
jgi:hypothetical protein